MATQHLRAASTAVNEINKAFEMRATKDGRYSRLIVNVTFHGDAPTEVTIDRKPFGNVPPLPANEAMFDLP